MNVSKNSKKVASGINPKKRLVLHFSANILIHPFVLKILCKIFLPCFGGFDIIQISILEVDKLVLLGLD